MEEINFKPSLKIEKKILIISFLILLLIILISIIFKEYISIISLIGIPFLIIFSTLGKIILKYFRTYTINEKNEIQSEFDFIDKSSQTYRIDQITSLTLSQNFLEKIFNLGTISFGIFGKNNPFAQSQPNYQNSYNSYNSQQKFETIEGYKEIFSKLNNKIGINQESSIVYEDKPSTKPIKFKQFIWFLLTLISLSLSLFIKKEISTILIYISIFCFVVFIITIFQYLKIKSSKYIITENYIKEEYDYILGSKKIIVPLNKITNHDINKNLISYSLFNVSSLKIYTGGSNDPLFDSLDDGIKFNEILNKQLLKIRNKDNHLSENINLEKNIQSSQIQKKTEILYKTKPGIGFIITPQNISFLILSIVSIILIPIYLIYLISKIILWKNTIYKFYEDKVIVETGIININKKEIYYKNIKHILLMREYLFEKILNQGTIYIFTPGTGFAESKIESIKDFKEVYKDFKEVILNN